MEDESPVSLLLLSYPRTIPNNNMTKYYEVFFLLAKVNNVCDVQLAGFW